MLRIRGLEIDEEHLPQLVRNHRLAYPTTPEVEQKAKQLIESGFPSEDCVAFVQDVCRWGRYPGIAGKVAKHNKIEDISHAMRSAYEQLRESKTVDALKAINLLYGLGRVSFASKHLRFLAPQSAVILDSQIAKGLHYRSDQNGYRSFLDDCLSLTDQMNKTSIQHPFRPNKNWYVSDIELSIFAQLRGSCL